MVLADNKIFICCWSASIFDSGFFLLIPMPVQGSSMEDTVSQGDMVLVERLSSVKRFDVVVFNLPDGSTYVKRVIGLPGESVSYKDDQLYINDKKK